MKTTSEFVTKCCRFFQVGEVWDYKGAKECKSDRSRREVSNEYLVVKLGSAKAENEPSIVREKVVRQLET